MSNRASYTQAGARMAQGHAAKQEQVSLVSQQVNAHKAFLEARRQQLEKWVTGGVRPEALIRFALLDLQQSDKLRACDPASIYLGLLACAQTGLEPGALKGEAYLVPFGGRAQFMPGWRGLVKMARRSREVKSISAEVVRDADTFSLQLGTAVSIAHSPAIAGERGPVIGAYAVATLSHGAREVEWMDAEELAKIRRVAESRGKSPAWSQWESEMQRKSVIRRLCKRLPLGPDYYVASVIEQAHEEGQPVAGVLDVLTEGAATAAEQDAARMPRPPAPPSTEPAEPADVISDEEAELIRQAERSHGE